MPLPAPAAANDSKKFFETMAGVVITGLQDAPA
jgi:hypothetical protein